jgi:outer membrane autotransporter protein
MKTFTLLFFIASQSFALMTEIGASYSYSKKTFNAANYYQSDSKSASVSLYFLEQFALELSYTDQFYESQEADSNSTRTVQQSTKITGADLIYVITDQRSAFQPYLKAGGAYIAKKKQVKYINADVIDIPTRDGLAPSYGIGLKYKLTEKFSVKTGYDIWQTPLDDGTTTEDSSFKVGLSWYL